MSKDLKSVAPKQSKSGSKTKHNDKPKRRIKLSLYPLNVETALSAALKTGAPPKDEEKPRSKRSAQ
jgi:hypothetical protein